MISSTLLLVVIVAFSVGVGAGYIARQMIAKSQVRTAEGQVSQIITEAKTKAQEVLLEAKNKAVTILEKADEEEKERKQAIRSSEKRLEKRENILDKKLDEAERDKKALEKKAQEVRDVRARVEEMREEEIQRLESISELTQEQAKKALLQLTEEQNREELAEQIARLQKQSHEDLEKEARDIMTHVIQKYSRSHAAEVMTSTLSIPNEEIKGKIIGKEGRNIRSLERMTGVEVIIDETPDSIVLSSFDPVRREVAKIALEKLIEDGRIHPAKIEEIVAWAEKEIDTRIREAGDAAAYEVGIAGLDPKLLYMLGRLRYRTSFKQNVLLHSLEVAYLSGALAAELGCDVKVAKMAGLFHDIGKAVDHEVQGTHVEIGIKILQKFNVDQKVIDGMRSHHDEYPYSTPESYIVTAADALSAARPGARKDTVENYLKRLEELEAITNSFDEVEKCYAIQAGREVRVFVHPEEVDDLGSIKLARNIADKIEEELKYPGEIKVNVFRETRAVEYAR
ncbi:MAG: ribonuclease Y [Candidatus Moraniibacteriota bacterium]|nr:MAG: ribonuclease Y [Candidatus Moranbacteria bacterium]